MHDLYGIPMLLGTDTISPIQQSGLFNIHSFLYELILTPNTTGIPFINLEDCGPPYRKELDIWPPICEVIVELLGHFWGF